MSHLSHIAVEAHERAIEHVNAGELDMACRKLARAFWLATTTGVVLRKQDADVLRGRLTDALGSRDGAA